MLSTSTRRSGVVVMKKAYTCGYGFTSASHHRICNTCTGSLRLQRCFSSSSSPRANKVVSKSSTSFLNRIRWRVLARVVKYIRIPFLVLSVYGLGYQQGIVDYSRDPAAKEQALLDSILAGVGVTDRQNVDAVTPSSSSWGPTFNTPKEQTRRVAHVGAKIVAMAQRHVREELEKAVAQAKTELPIDSTPEQILHALNQNEDVVFWDNAERRLEGAWSYLLVETDVANAFVTEILPKRIFITTSMFQFISNDDELALVLGHEVSHLILGHVSDANMLQTLLRTLEVLLLSVDPTEGLLSVAVVAFLATCRKALTAAHSRENEHQADDLGIKLAAMACYDTERAAHVFYKMHQYSTEKGADAAVNPSILSFLDTHPASDERHELLILASDLENVQKYQDSTCASVSTKLKGLLKPSSKE